MLKRVSLVIVQSPKSGSGYHFIDDLLIRSGIIESITSEPAPNSAGRFVISSPLIFDLDIANEYAFHFEPFKTSVTAKNIEKALEGLKKLSTTLGNIKLSAIGLNFDYEVPEDFIKSLFKSKISEAQFNASTINLKLVERPDFILNLTYNKQINFSNLQFNYHHELAGLELNQVLSDHFIDTCFNKQLASDKILAEINNPNQKTISFS